MKGAEPSIRVVSGWRGVGKTTFCRRLVEMGVARQLDVAGLLSPARFATNPDAGEPMIKTGIEVEDIRTGERRLLASSLEGELHGSKLGPWTFDDQVIEWGNAVLSTATPCDMLVIDELGPLEFERQKGWSISFDLIDRRGYRLAIIVVRPEYLDQFQQRWPDARLFNLIHGLSTV